MPVEHHLRGFCCANQTGLLSLHHLLGDVIKVFFFCYGFFLLSVAPNCYKIGANVANC